MDEFVPITPVNFYQFTVDCHQVGKKFPTEKKYHLPDLSELCGEPQFAEVAIAWGNDGFYCDVDINQSIQRSYYPDVYRGDSVELFIDTRDVKTSGFNTRFCHHFFFMPVIVDEHQMGEKTRFRTEDTHTLCDPKDLSLKIERGSHRYKMKIFIPTQCLYGYDPDQIDRLGFTYRINRPDGPSQHFSVVTDDYQVDQQPSLWSSLKLMK